MPAELHTTLTPDTPVRYLKGVGPKTAERFEIGRASCRERVLRRV